jgi:hypothetical protein
MALVLVFMHTDDPKITMTVTATVEYAPRTAVG